MKRIAAFVILAIAAYSIYFDLTKGTIPVAVDVATAKEKEVSSEEEEYFLYKVKPGDTVLSVLELKMEGSLPVPVSRAVNDFEKLNGKAPEEIKLSETYKFPLYDGQAD
ncbi:hypothetical protein [Bacillus massilinigeriensis]|uniref:hypothetical protein n=1 Tax=Bacillus mediterraneensis TaxID=1805474 RepID=UPI0008F895C6|nr:hypothetical protein [Bacillus mediterraneensis]